MLNTFFIAVFLATLWNGMKQRKVIHSLPVQLHPSLFLGPAFEMGFMLEMLPEM